MYYNYLIYFIVFFIVYTLINNNSTQNNLLDDYLRNKIHKQEKLLLELQQKINKKKNKDSIEQMENVEFAQNQQNQQEQQYLQSQPISQSQQQLINQISGPIPETQIPLMNKLMNPIQQTNNLTSDQVYKRDQTVLYDRLYPPLGRTERPQFDLLMNYINANNGVFNTYTRGPPDTFRSVGYLTPINKTATIDSTLILYGRAKYPNSDIGEFYVSSSNKISDIKIPLNEYNSNVRKITDIPSIINISGNILNGQYNFTELPKANLDYPYI